MTHVEQIGELKVFAEMGCYHPDMGDDNTCPTRYGKCESCHYCKVTMSCPDYIKLRQAAQEKTV